MIGAIGRNQKRGIIKLSKMGSRTGLKMDTKMVISDPLLILNLIPLFNIYLSIDLIKIWSIIKISQKMM